MADIECARRAEAGSLFAKVVNVGAGQQGCGGPIGYRAVEVCLAEETPIDGKYSRWFDTIGARVVLIRPDFHVFGTSSGDTGSTNLLVADLLRSVTQRTD